MGEELRFQGTSLRRDRVAGTEVLAFDRPEAKNAIDPGTMDAFEEALLGIERDEGVRAVVVTAAGDTFVSGGDVKALEGLAEVHRMGPILDRLAALPVPVIGAANGPAYGGGCEILLACDTRIGEARAEWAFRQVAMAVTPGWGGAARLVRLVGPGAAARLLFSGDPISSAEALRLGLYDEVVEADARGAALRLAERIARWSPQAVRLCKRALGGDEEAAFAEAWESEDHREAVRAFLERRVFKSAPRT
jgi:enoyl-CoA hydratase